VELEAAFRENCGRPAEPGPISGGEVTGTKWQFEDALA
jgi:hypothetical protein